MFFVIQISQINACIILYISKLYNNIRFLQGDGCYYVLWV